MSKLYLKNSLLSFCNLNYSFCTSLTEEHPQIPFAYFVHLRFLSKQTIGLKATFTIRLFTFIEILLVTKHNDVSSRNNINMKIGVTYQVTFADSFKSSKDECSIFDICHRFD